MKQQCDINGAVAFGMNKICQISWSISLKYERRTPVLAMFDSLDGVSRNQFDIHTWSSVGGAHLADTHFRKCDLR